MTSKNKKHVIRIDKRDIPKQRVPMPQKPPSTFKDRKEKRKDGGLSKSSRYINHE